MPRSKCALKKEYGAVHLVNSELRTRAAALKQVLSTRQHSVLQFMKSNRSLHRTPQIA
jgi:hypothetical protein